MNARPPSQAFPEPALRRLPSYRKLLSQAKSIGQVTITCTQIGKALKLDPTQVRKDLALTGIVGKPRVGYELDALIDSIEEFLGWRNNNDAFLVGVGSLGRALLGYEMFKTRGLNIVAAFDNNPDVIGNTFHGREVFSVDRFADLAQRMRVNIGVIATPSSVAQSIANQMILAGIKGIWNFAPSVLDVSEGIILENVDLAASLAVLSAKLAEQLRSSRL